MIQHSFRPIVLARFLLCRPFFVMLFLMLIEAALSAATTYLVIEAGRDVAKGTFLLADLLWILAAQSASYVVGAVSWIFAERTGFLAYGALHACALPATTATRPKLLGDKEARERVEPFLTGETFYVYFHLLYEIEGDLRILLALILNVIVLGHPDRRLAAGRLRAGVRRAVPAAMDDAKARRRAPIAKTSA